MEVKIVLLIIGLALAHWLMVPWALGELVGREKVLGGRKGIWALGILFITYFGPLFYLALHPKPQTEAEGYYDETYYD